MKRKQFLCLGLIAALGISFASCKSECESDEKKCEHGSLYSCDDGEWVAVPTIVPCGEEQCEDGATKCENGSAYECSNGEWVPSTKVPCK